MLMRYLNTLTGNEIEARSEMYAPHLVKIEPEKEIKVEDKPAKKPATKKGTKKK